MIRSCARSAGRSIPQAFFQRDPLSPPFHATLVLGLCFLQALPLVPLHRLAPVDTCALPIRFQFPGSLARQTTGKERQDGTEKPTPEQMRIGASTSALSKIDPALLSKTDPWPARGRGR